MYVRNDYEYKKIKYAMHYVHTYILYIMCNATLILTQLIILKMEPHNDPVAQLSGKVATISLSQHLEEVQVQNSNLSSYFSNAPVAPSSSFFDQLAKPDARPITSSASEVRHSAHQPAVPGTGHLFMQNPQDSLQRHMMADYVSVRPLPEDVFTGSGSDSDRRRNAWIPSEEVRRILVLIATNSPGSMTPDDNLTKPGVVLEEEMVNIFKR